MGTERNVILDVLVGGMILLAFNGGCNIDKKLENSQEQIIREIRANQYGINRIESQMRELRSDYEKLKTKYLHNDTTQPARAEKE